MSETQIFKLILVQVVSKRLMYDGENPGGATACNTNPRHKPSTTFFPPVELFISRLIK